MVSGDVRGGVSDGAGSRAWWDKWFSPTTPRGAKLEVCLDRKAVAQMLLELAELHENDEHFCKEAVAHLWLRKVANNAGGAGR